MVIRDADDQRRYGLVRQLSKQVSMSAGFLIPVSVVDVHQLSSVIRNRIENVLVIDSRSFIEHNACHIASAVNVCCSKIVKRRLQQDKLSVKELLMHTCHCEVDEKLDVVVYDQSSKDADCLPVDSFIVILIKKLQLTFRSVNLLKGGFEEFQKCYPDLCEDKTRKYPPLTSLSQPCLPITNQGPTRILPFLYLGSQFDAMNKELLKDHNITYELNVSTTCPQPEFVPEGHFMRIPVNDSYSEKLLPYFPEAFNFLDKVREGSGCVLVHCLAGISRSPTIAIAYVMRYLRLSSDDGYRYVKSKRPTISPNFNFLGQLLEYEKQLRKENVLEAKPEVTSAPPLCSKKRLCRTDMRTSKLFLDIDPNCNENSNVFLQPRSGDQSPTTALAKLSFDVNIAPSREETNQPTWSDFRPFRSKSCYGDWLRDYDESLVERKPRDGNVTATSKVLSPVKEIKCDALISEISTGESEISVKSRGTIRQKSSSSYISQEDRSSFSQFYGDKLASSSTNAEEIFSLQTLSHVSSSLYEKSLEIPKKKAFEKIKTQSSPSKFLEPEKFPCSAKAVKDIDASRPFLAETGSKRVYRCPLDRSKEFTSKKEKMESYFVFREHASPQYKSTSTLHPFSLNYDSHKRSDSTATSGFGSESSDCADNHSDAGKKADTFKLEIDVEDLEDDVIAQKKGFSSKASASHASHETSKSERTFFPLALSDVSVTDWVHNIGSPLSPSESHLLDDLEAEKDVANNKTELSSPSGSSYPSEDPDSFHDSGVPLSPSWVWPRKRVASCDTTIYSSGSTSPTKDKRKCEPFAEPLSTSLIKDRGLWFLERERYLASNEETYSETHLCHSSISDDKMGLYRVQSCPVIMCHIPSFSASEDRFRVFSRERRYEKVLTSASISSAHKHKEISSHESCPDVLHLSEGDSSLGMLSYRQKEFRRNERLIQVS